MVVDNLTYSGEKQEMVDQALHKFFPPPTRYPQVVLDAMHHSLFAGGKRFRPIVTIEVAGTFGIDAKKVLPTACAIELIHTYSLIHDDLPAIDNDDLRRGKPTCHVKFGEDIAILAGDALFAEAFYLIAKEQKAEKSKWIVEVISEISAASGVRGMVGGQVVDVSSAGKKINSKTLEYIHEHKTGKLITAAARVGAILAGTSARELEVITDYAHYLGLTFQIIDDILDVIGDEEVLGKKPGSDERGKKATFPSVYGIKEAQDFAKKYLDEANKQLKGLDRDVKGLSELAQFVYQRKR